VSNNDSFIEEVTEEVRRDRLFRLMRRYGWIAVLLVVLLVGGAAFNEWKKAQSRSVAQTLGDEIIAALESEESADRIAALSEISAEGDATAILRLLRAMEDVNAQRPEAAAQALSAIAADPAIPQIYRDLAVLKRAIMDAGVSPVAERSAALQGIAVPGAPFRLLAEEQLALIDIETDNTEAAIVRLRAILEDGEATTGLRNRAAQLIVALGGELEAG